ncbi:transposase, IS605 OrfB family [Hydrogenobacter thermophilus TK-6]|uniref:Transposase n=1 Tax=Hydrogenobacter thermophilus (strain DSM 6534 / IAM 12695 / TK-6) TaxID=608538 RepID=D3DK65_HYDTT|nr:RNA-guided endonuclease TnpB family protein [Hydrogenobacter thermophilus]ADO46136.1 transposase, IS605 OrfB family [Hydrogenobacter thermophilus TK-6]BAI70217.1 transposase [Hydrogenobacter thermophilus TK-6]
MPKLLRCLTIALTDVPEEYKIALGYLTYHSGRLYNQALYLLKNKLARVNMFDLYNKLNSSIHLKALQSRSAQIVLDQLVRAYRNWFEYLKNPQKFKGQEIKPPKFRKKTKPHRTLTYDRTGFKIVGTKIRLSLSKDLRKFLKEKHDIHIKYLWIETGLELREELIRNIQIVPKGNEFELHIVYSAEKETKEQEGNRAMVIDPNSENFMVIGIDGVKTPYIVDGRGLKSLLRKYLKKIAKLQSLKDNLKNKRLPYHRVEERINKLWTKVKRLLRHYAHTVSNLILELAIKHRVKEIWIGNSVKNKNRESNLNSIADQIWSLLPHGKVKEYLEYKAEPYGIAARYIDERYTSGVDSTLECGVCKENYTPEGRIKRGLFKTSRGYLNADVNAVRNMLKKLERFDQITAVAKPVRVRIFKSISVSSLYGQIGGRSRGSVNLPVVVRDTSGVQTHHEAPHL